MPRKLAVHEQVAHTAKQLAMAHFEEIVRKDNRLYTAFKAKNPGVPVDKLQEAFGEAFQAQFIDLARATMVELLKRPDLEHLHAAIADALIKDGSLRYGRGKRPMWRV